MLRLVTNNSPVHSNHAHATTCISFCFARGPSGLADLPDAWYQLKRQLSQAHGRNQVIAHAEIGMMTLRTPAHEWQKIQPAITTFCAEKDIYIHPAECTVINNVQGGHLRQEYR